MRTYSFELKFTWVVFQHDHFRSTIVQWENSENNRLGILEIKIHGTSVLSIIMFDSIEQRNV